MRRDKITKGMVVVLIFIAICVSVGFFFFLQKDEEELKSTRSEISNTTKKNEEENRIGTQSARESYDASETKDKGVSEEATLGMQDDSTLEKDGETDKVVTPTGYDSTSIQLIMENETVQEELDADIYYIRNLIYDNLYKRGYREMKNITIKKGKSDKAYMNLYYATPDNPGNVTIKVYYSAAARIVELSE